MRQLAQDYTIVAAQTQRPIARKSKEQIV